LPSFPARGGDFLTSNLPQMLAYLGYAPLLPDDLQRLDPEVIMDYQRLLGAVANPQDFRNFTPLAKGEILVTRFFAPKITSVKVLPATDFGWRKLVRFRARGGSAAKKDGLDSLYLLFNFASGSRPQFPAGVPAGQIQSILIPVYPRGNHFDAYYFVYNSLSGKCPKADAQGNVTLLDCKAGQLGLYLTASFDANSLPQKNYYIANACSQCHGSSGQGKDGSKVNYLDTDHWYDRVQPPDGDFKQVAREDVLVKGGGRAMKVLYDLNTEIWKQNEAVKKGSFQSKAALKWLELHKDCEGGLDQCADKHFEPILRGLPSDVAGGPVWTAQNENDKKLLPILNQVCFRCHSSFSYHVFDKTAVVDKIKNRGLISRVSSGSMPPDRRLSDSDKTNLVNYLKTLQSENP
jgi:hypothetical protein